MMKEILEEIHKDMEKIEKDERDHYKPAVVRLALIQTEMNAKMTVLQKYEKMLQTRILFDPLSQAK